MHFCRNTHVIASFRELLADETGNATFEYALVATAFALLIVGLMTTITNVASGQIAYTDSGLNNRNGVTN